MRDYIMHNQEQIIHKKKTIGEYILEIKLEAFKR